MLEFTDKRKNFRFPAFDDANGVKLPMDSQRLLFDGEFSSVFSANQPVRTTEATYESLYLGEEPSEPLVSEELPLPEPYVPAKPKPLKRNQGTPASYGRATSIKEPVEVQKPVFYSDHRASLEKKLVAENKNDSRELSHQASGKYSGRSYFVPRHIPASIIPVEVVPNQNKQEMIARMKKAKGSYLVLEAEADQAFRFGKIEKKAISPFERQEEQSEIPFTRREFKQLKRETQSKSAGVPAFTQKKQQENQGLQGKGTRLEKSLSGIMAEEQGQSTTNKYFD